MYPQHVPANIDDRKCQEHAKERPLFVWLQTNKLQLFCYSLYFSSDGVTQQSIDLIIPSFSLAFKFFKHYGMYPQHVPANIDDRKCQEHAKERPLFVWLQTNKLQLFCYSLYFSSDGVTQQVHMIPGVLVERMNFESQK